MENIYRLSNLTCRKKLRKDNKDLRVLFSGYQSSLKNQLKKADKNNIDFAVIIGPEEVRSNNFSLKKLKEDGTYNAFAIRCWPEMFTEYGGAICAPASMLTENKVPCACEADVYGAVTQLILQEVSGQSVFLTDIVDIDLEDNSGVFWHCGQAPISMCNPKIKPTATIHSNRKMPLLFEFPLKEGIVTMMRISQSFGEQKMVLSKGKMIDRPLPFTGTSGVINFDNDTKEVLNNIISYGLEHHIAITYGDHIELLSELASELKLPILYI